MAQFNLGLASEKIELTEIADRMYLSIYIIFNLHNIVNTMYVALDKRVYQMH